MRLEPVETALPDGDGSWEGADPSVPSAKRGVVPPTISAAAQRMDGSVTPPRAAGPDAISNSCYA